MAHEERSHSLLSASGSERWLNCTPSARQEEKVKEQASSSYAQEGTLAHEFGEIGILHALGQMNDLEYSKKFSELATNEFYSEEMDDEVQKYVDFVMAEFEASKAITPDAVIMLEESIDLTHYIKEGFGTNDCVIIADKILKVIDLKYGKGIRIYPEQNSQLKLYGLGALRKYELSFDIETVELTIIQPRLDHGNSWRISVIDLINWGDTVVKPKATMAYAGKGEFCPGDWCKWCAVKPKCRALQKRSMEVAKHEFAEPALLTDDEILIVYEQMHMIQDWFSSVSAYIMTEATNGKVWKGYKLVEGKSNRKWVDESVVSKILLDNKYEPTEFMITKLGGIGIVEKLLGKAKFAEVLATQVVKPQGSPTLVPESDKRSAMGIEQAKKDFTNN
jgi:hypothetical protein